MPGRKNNTLCIPNVTRQQRYKEYSLPCDKIVEESQTCKKGKYYTLFCREKKRSEGVNAGF